MASTTAEATATTVPEPDEAQFEVHEMRITNHGKINAWVDYALQFFEVNEEKALVLHTLPAKPLEREKPAEELEEGETEEKDDKKKGTANPNLPTTTIPRLISVVEIIKREYVKAMATNKVMEVQGLHQYNQIGYLEETEGEEDEGEEDFLKTLETALSGSKHVKMKRTAYMKVTLCRRELNSLAEKGATYQKPVKREMSKSARGRMKKRMKMTDKEEEDGPAETMDTD